MRPTARQRITPSEIAVAVAVLVLPPLAIGGVLYGSLAPFDDNAAVQHPAFTAAAEPAHDPATDPATASGVGGRRDQAPVDDAAARSAPTTASAPTPAAAATPPAAPPKRSVRRHAHRPPPPDDFPQKMKNWFANVARDVGVLPRDGATTDAGR